MEKHRERERLGGGGGGEELSRNVNTRTQSAVTRTGKQRPLRSAGWEGGRIWKNTIPLKTRGQHTVAERRVINLHLNGLDYGSALGYVDSTRHISQHQVTDGDHQIHELAT